RTARQPITRWQHCRAAMHRILLWYSIQTCAPPATSRIEQKRDSTVMFQQSMTASGASQVATACSRSSRSETADDADKRGCPDWPRTFSSALIRVIPGLLIIIVRLLLCAPPRAVKLDTADSFLQFGKYPEHPRSARRTRDALRGYIFERMGI